MMKIFSMTATALALSLAMSACASTVDEDETDPLDDPRVGEKVDRICFTSSISGFSDWDSDNGVILTKGVRDKYLVTLFPGCTALGGAQSIGVNDQFGSGCLRRGDNLTISESLFGSNSSDPFSTDRCRITAIYEWNEDAGEMDDEE